MAKKGLSTQDFINISNIQEDVVILKTGGLRQVVLVSGVNLDLKSDEERNNVLALYRRFVNSLDFSIQILVHSRKFNIENYIKNVEEREKVEPNGLLKNQIFEYKEFIKTFVQENDIMTKMFLAVVPFQSFSLAPKKGFLSRFFKSKAPAAESVSEQQQQLNFRQLRQRTDQVIDGLQAVGLRAVVLNTEELTELFYNFYNPEAIEKENLSILNPAPGA